MASPAERYLNHLVGIFGQEPSFYRVDSLLAGVPGITTIVFRNIPEDGYLTAFTYGLSLVPHPDWINGRVELCISLRSDDVQWSSALSNITNKLRGECPFTYGETINFGTRISFDSEMSAFFIFAPSTIEREDYSDIEVGEEYKIFIKNLYPIYEDEIEVLATIGLKEFWHHPDFDNYEVNRKHVKLI